MTGILIGVGITLAVVLFLDVCMIDKAAENLPDVSVLAGSKPPEYSFVMALPNGYSVKCRGLSE